MLRAQPYLLICDRYINYKRPMPPHQLRYYLETMTGIEYPSTYVVGCRKTPMRTSGVETSIMRVNKATCAEARPLLYKQKNQIRLQC